MGRRKEIIDEELVKKAQEDVKKIKDYKIIIRLQAIIGGRYPLKEVREILGVSRHSVRLWAKRYKEEGLDGLSDKKKGHRRRKLGEEEESEIRRWLRGCVDSRGRRTHWTIEKLRKEIEEVFGIKISKTPLWRLIRLMGFRQKSSRPPA